MSYISLSEEIEKEIWNMNAARNLSPYACNDIECIRRDMERDRATALRPAYLRDVDKIINIPFYMRYSDKTQVFSLQKNDDISRRAYHVQLVARIAKNIGRALNLNLDLIEAIALGHDLGHTPFGHEGEKKLSEIYQGRCGRFFNHNIQSARILDTLFTNNVSLQTLDGIICHNGELELSEYRPIELGDFNNFDSRMEMCCTNRDGINALIPGTLEGCVVRISDIIAYLGKDRQDAIRLGLVEDNNSFSQLEIGNFNAEIINNMTVNIIERSFGKPYLSMDENYFKALSLAKEENYKIIYNSDATSRGFKEEIAPMFEEIYEHLRNDLVTGNKASVIYKHHLIYIYEYTKHYQKEITYLSSNPDDIVVDYIASMTDDYFIDLYAYLFPKGKHKVEYRGYFE